MKTDKKRYFWILEMAISKNDKRRFAFSCHQGTMDEARQLMEIRYRALQVENPTAVFSGHLESGAKTCCIIQDWKPPA